MRNRWHNIHGPFSKLQVICFVLAMDRSGLHGPLHSNSVSGWNWTVRGAMWQAPPLCLVDMIMTVISMLIGSVVFALTIAEITSLIQSMNSSASSYKEKLTQVKVRAILSSATDNHVSPAPKTSLAPIKNSFRNTWIFAKFHNTFEIESGNITKWNFKVWTSILIWYPL